MSDRKILNQQERLDLNKKLALSYCNVYTKHEVKDGEEFDWKFSENADYGSPYFGNCTIDLHKNPISVSNSASFEALAYSIEFPDFGMIDFDYWAAVDGCAWKSNMGRH